MQLTPATADALYYAFNFAFQAAVTAGSPGAFYPKIVSEFTSTGRENRYPWVERLQKMREWFGPRQYQNLKARTYILKNRKFEESIELDRDEVEDDNYQIFAAQAIPSLAFQVNRNPDFLVQDALANGDSTSDIKYQAFDGQPFFSASHPVDMDDSSKGTYSNLSATTPFNGTNFAGQRAIMRDYVAIDGTKAGVNPDTVVVPTDLEIPAAQVLKSVWTSPASAVGANAANAPSENILKGMCNLQVFDLLTDANDWYLMDLSKPVKPIVHQTRRAVEFTFLNRPTDANYFEQEKLRFGASKREAVGYSMPQFALKCTN